jgi:hypothetical protein
VNAILRAIWGYIAVRLSLDLLARKRATLARTTRVSYKVNRRLENCPYGITFDDDALHRTSGIDSKELYTFSHKGQQKQASDPLEGAG